VRHAAALVMSPWNRSNANEFAPFTMAMWIYGYPLIVNPEFSIKLTETWRLCRLLDLVK
jgi:hypothetical protein